MTVTAIQIGLHPDAVDFESADFSQFKGLTKEGLTKANSDNVAGLRAAGYEVDNCLIGTGEAGAEKARTWLATKSLRRRPHRRRRPPRRRQHPALRSDRERGARRQSRLPIRVQLLGDLDTRRHPPVVSQPGRRDPGGVTMTNPHSVDVLVVGAGPAGLTAAGDLARCGRSVAVLERWPEMNPSSRAFATMARTLEVLDARGLADDVLAHAHRAPGVSIFAGARIDLTHLRSAYQFVAVTPQTNVDRALAEYAANQGADIRRGFEVVALEQDPDGVTVTARPKDDDDPRAPPDMAREIRDRRRRRAQHRAGSRRRGVPG